QQRCSLVFSQDISGLNQISGNCPKPRLNRLNHKRQAVDHGGNHQTRKGENQPDIQVGLQKSPETVLRAEGQKQIETQDGGRQHQGQTNQCFQDKFASARAECQPVGDGNPQRQKQDGRRESELQCKVKRLKIQHQSGFGEAKIR